MKIIVRSEIFDVQECIIKKIPYLQTLKEMMNEKKLEEILLCDTLSPRFLQIIIEYLKNDYNYKILSQILYNEFEDTILKQNFSYLCLEKLYEIVHLYRYN